MMKLHAALTTGLATLLVAPAALSADELETLEAALRSTSRALDVVVGVEQRAAEDPAAAIPLVRQVTEAPVLDAERRDARLQSLRSEVDLLRTELDQLELAALQEGAQPLTDLRPPTARDPRTTASGAPTELPAVSTGLDDATRLALAKAKADALARARGDLKGDEPSAGNAHPTTNENGYSADPVRHARACYRAGRYDEGLALLKDAETPEGLFWRARCNERLDDLDAAEADLRELITIDADGPFAARALADLEFVKWKRDFLQRMEGKR